MRPSVFAADTRGGVSVEMAFLTAIMVLLTGGTIEAGFAYHQNGSAQHAVRHGARLAVLSDPVSTKAPELSGTFRITCKGSTKRCSRGGFDAAAFGRILMGADGDGECGAAPADRRGICDVNTAVKADDLVIVYARERRGEAPIVTVTLRERPLKTALIGPLMPKRWRTLPRVSATQTGGDLSG